MMNEFNKNDWSHFHDVILYATWDDDKVSLTQIQMETMFESLPIELKEHAILVGMNDTVWRDNLCDWYIKNK